jgi:hypothetical protein
VSNQRRFNQDADYGRQLILVQRDGYAVVVDCNDEGQVMTEHVRIIDLYDQGRELAFWNATEVSDDIKDSTTDPTTAFNALLSAIELIASGNYPRRKV